MKGDTPALGAITAPCYTGNRRKGMEPLPENEKNGTLKRNDIMADYDYERWMRTIEHDLATTMVETAATASAFLDIRTGDVDSRLENGRAEDMHLDKGRCEEISARVARLGDMVRQLRGEVDGMADEFQGILG